jgi:regulator of sigma E protease
MLLTIIVFILVLSVLVFVHELGHFVAARRFGVRAEEFGFGFPPRARGVQLWRKNNQDGTPVQKAEGERSLTSKFNWRWVSGSHEITEDDSLYGTVYSINWLPLGGFVKIKGENGEKEADRDSFGSRPIWQRSVILSAGVAMNVLLAMVIIIFGMMIGLPQAIDGLDQRVQISDRKIQVMQVMPELPAELAGMKIGDAILSINNEEFSTYTELQDFIDKNVGQPLHYLVGRGQQQIAMTITPIVIEETGKGGVGIGIAETGIVSYPWYLAIWEGVKTTFLLLWAIVVAFYQLLKGLIMGQGVSADLSGPVGIAVITGQVARLGFVYLMQFTAMLSLNLAIINFLPLPALDGGRILFLIIEKIKGSPVKREFEAIAHNIGFALLMLLVVVVTFKDIARFEPIKNLISKLIN